MKTLMENRKRIWIKNNEKKKHVYQYKKNTHIISNPSSNKTVR